jgi:DNA-binding transcriptional MerR regulator
MVKCFEAGSMLIGEFAQHTGLTQDTIRLYIRKGLLAPKLSAKGGSNPYQAFDERDVSLVQLIRFAKALGMTLKEIAAVAFEMRSEGLSPQREIELMDAQLARLEEKRLQLEVLTSYARAKRDWMARGKPDDEPRFMTCQIPR